MKFLTGVFENIDSHVSFFKDKLILNLLGLSVILNILIWIFVAIKFKSGMESVVLHYNVDFGADMVDAWFKIFAIPVAALILLAVNFVLGYLFSRSERIISYVLGGMALVLQIFFLVTIITLWIINKV